MEKFVTYLKILKKIAKHFKIVYNNKEFSKTYYEVL